MIVSSVELAHAEQHCDFSFTIFCSQLSVAYQKSTNKLLSVLVRLFVDLVPVDAGNLPNELLGGQWI